MHEKIAPFQPARLREVWRLAWVKAVAFAPFFWPASCRRLVGVVTYVSALVWLVGWAPTGHLYSTRRRELVVIAEATTPGFTAQFGVFIVGALFAVFGVTGGWVGAGITVGAFAVLVAAPSIVASVQAVLDRDVRRALGEVREGMKARGGGHTVLSAAKPSGCEKGTIKRIAQFVRTRPDLQPAFAVAANEKLAEEYAEEMMQIGVSGLAFVASAEEGPRQLSEPERSETHRR
ncbi:hypothetical protein ACTJKO_00565 [Curtobacterium sp. 22159]|uniref:hypothetical protein n=1 Tax=Curtobacterium sp. 22159 TaxID=3453882 RepID=UPI003F859C35